MSASSSRIVFANSKPSTSGIMISEMIRSTSVPEYVGLAGAEASHGVVPVLAQIRADCLIKLPVVLYNQQLEHAKASLSLLPVY